MQTTSTLVLPAHSIRSCHGVADIRFERLNVPEWKKTAPFTQMAEKQYDMQLQIEETELALEIGSASAAKRFKKVRRNLLTFAKRCAGQPTYLLLGTARTACVHAHSKAIIRDFGHLAGMCQLGHANGWAESGSMGVGCRAQVLGWENDFERAKRAPLIGTPLKFRHQTTEVPFNASEYIDAEWGSDPELLDQVVWVAPKHGTIQTRTAFGLYGFTEILLMVFDAGGLGTDEEGATDGLGRQMHEAIHTHWTGFRPDCIPPRVWLDSPLSSGSWFREGDLMRIRARLDRGTANPENYSDIHVIRIVSDPEKHRNGWKDLPVTIKFVRNSAEAAMYMMHLANHTYRNLLRCYDETTA